MGGIIEGMKICNYGSHLSDSSSKVLSISTMPVHGCGGGVEKGGGLAGGFAWDEGECARCRS